jgi:hypothetical protein
LLTVILAQREEIGEMNVQKYAGNVIFAPKFAKDLILAISLLFGFCSLFEFWNFIFGI